MNFVRKPVKDKVTGVSFADDAAALRTFVQPSCAALIWRRRTPPEMQSWLDRLDPEAMPRGRVILPPSAARTTVGHLCYISGLAEGPETAWLQDDIASLADIFCELMNAKFLRLRLDVVTTNACRKFHTDAVTARLVCTYRGTGTQYGTSTDGSDPKRVFTVQTGAPVLLRGTLWPERPSSGLMHRSPPIEGTSETRLVLVLDPVQNPKTEA